MAPGELAEATGIAKSTVYQWEAGETLPHVKTLPRLTWALGLQHWEDLAKPPAWSASESLRLREWMQFRGLTGRALADRSGASRPTVYNLCAGRCKPSAKTLRRFASALGIPREWLFALPQDMYDNGSDA
jgi:transcriptional regulator with XRE-family HTH domain